MKKLIAATFAGLLAMALPVDRAVADSAPQEILDKALATYREMTADPDFKNLHGLLERARAVIIVPEMLKAGFIIGGEFGNGVLLARDDATDTWSQPAFFKIGEGSIGLQIGASMSQVVLVVMTDKGLGAILEHKVTLGADASVAAGPVGAGVDAQSTTDVNNDIYSYAKSEGLFAGVAVEGAVIEPDTERNARYYGEAYTPTQIVAGQAPARGGADELRAALATP